MDDVCGRHPTIAVNPALDGDETDLCMLRCTEVMKHISEGKRLIADPAFVIHQVSRDKLAQLVGEPHDDLNRMIDTLHYQNNQTNTRQVVSSANIGFASEDQTGMLS
jgi:hypothetical protein